MFEIMQVVQNIEHEGKDVVHLEIGDTTGFTNESLKSYISNALIDIPFSYSPSAGELDLRTSAAKLFSEDINKEVAAQQVGVAPANAVVGVGRAQRRDRPFGTPLIFVIQQLTLVA